MPTISGCTSTWYRKQSIIQDTIMTSNLDLTRFFLAAAIPVEYLQLIDLVVHNVVELGVRSSGQTLLAGELVDSYVTRLAFLS